MTELAAPMALAAVLAMVIAALRLLSYNDLLHGRRFITLTPTLSTYVFFHGLATLLPFLFFRLWPNDWQPLISVSPMLIAVIAPFVINQMLKLEGLDPPETTGSLSRFRGELIREFEQRMIDEEFAAMRNFIAPYVESRNFFEVRALAMQNIPMQLPAQKIAAFRHSLFAVTTVEEAMEMYVRHVGKKSFRSVFGMTQSEMRPALAPLPLFDELEKQSHQTSSMGSRIAARFRQAGLDEPIPELRDNESAALLRDQPARAAGFEP